MKVIARSVCATLLVSALPWPGAVQTVSAGANLWTTHGPEGGSVRALAIDPQTPTTLYVGTTGGVFKSTDGGGSWTQSGLNQSIRALAIDPQTPPTLYGSTNGGVFKSSDGGGSWSAVNNGLTTTASGVANGSVRALLVPQDTVLNLDATNYSGQARLMTYTWPDYRVANAILMKFDLSGLPAGAVVQEAMLDLSLVQSDAMAESTYAVTAHKVVGKDPVVAAGSGYTADGVTSWTANACCYNGVPLAQADISPAYDTQAIDKAPGFKSWTLTAMVREWLANPATNRGLLLNSDAAKPRDRYRYFASTEHPDPGLRPVLRVSYVAETSPSTATSTAP